MLRELEKQAARIADLEGQPRKRVREAQVACNLRFPGQYYQAETGLWASPDSPDTELRCAGDRKAR